MGLTEEMTRQLVNFQPVGFRSFYKNDTVGITPTRKIKIVKNIARSEVTGNPKDTTFRFETFPEGGNLSSGLSQNIIESDKRLCQNLGIAFFDI